MKRLLFVASCCFTRGKRVDFWRLWTPAILPPRARGSCRAIATDLLANENAGNAAIIGTGVQGEFQLRYLHQVRELVGVIVFDIIQDRARDFAERMSLELGVDIAVSPSLQAAVRDAEILLVATWSREPLLRADMVKNGAHVSTLGADELGKCEVHADLIGRSVFVCDDRELAVSTGAIGAAGLGPEAIHAEVGEVLAGEHPGRVNRTQITIFGGVGLAFQDLVLAGQVYQAACENGTGRPFDFLDQ